MSDIVNYRGKNYSRRHGGPFDRGSADSYYGRPYNPHYYRGATYTSTLVPLSGMTPSQIDNYAAGYNWNEECGDKKEW